MNDIDDVDAGVGCELELLDPVCRADPRRVAALLADDFSRSASRGVCGADIVLIGVGHGNNTGLHLAEMRALGAVAPMRRDGVPLLVDGQQRWTEYPYVDFDESDFVLLGDAYCAAGGTEMRAPLGAGEIRRLPMRELVAFGTRWLAEHRLQRC